MTYQIGAGRRRKDVEKVSEVESSRKMAWEGREGRQTEGQGKHGSDGKYKEEKKGNGRDGKRKVEKEK